MRRGEVTSLAGVSPEYYTRLEQGKLGGVSESILHALAQALQLDEAERAHLFHLARTAGSTARPRRRPKQQIPPSLNTLWMPSPEPPRSYATAAWTSWPSTAWVEQASTPSTSTPPR
ncbi:helix-turn-helix transcriptional regulator [Arthrobacter sp. Soil736]|uniref:helix-turn-helix domain-containing protein n=1 Tax=Arthrobacter sp. Soil736 TaxID=1736395 RepID=UPI003211E93C